jgi:ABC-type lipoprotein release transport system permease subunit
VGAFINVGAVFDSLKCVDIPKFELPIPPLPEQRASDPLTYIMLTLLLAAASAAACYVPARKAAKADPMVVMRGET